MFPAAAMIAVGKKGQKGKGKKSATLKKQKGKGRMIPFAGLAGNRQIGRRRNRNKLKKLPSPLKSVPKRKKRSTQIPINDGFIGISARNRPLRRSRPINGVVNTLPTVRDRPSQLNAQPQQLAWE